MARLSLREVLELTLLKPRYPTFPPDLATPIFRDLERHALLSKGWDWAYSCFNGKFEIAIYPLTQPSWRREFVVKGKPDEKLYEAMVSAVVKLWML